MKNLRIYVAEFNRCRGDNIRLCVRRLNRLGICTSIIPHKTSLRMERPVDMSWANFLNVLRSQLNPRLGAVLLFSQRTGNAFLCRNRSNRPGRFARV